MAMMMMMMMITTTTMMVMIIIITKIIPNKTPRNAQPAEVRTINKGYFRH
jgi:hypothetical protein